MRNSVEQIAGLMALYSVLTGTSKEDTLKKFMPEDVEEDISSEGRYSSEEIIKRTTGIDMIPLRERFQNFEEEYGTPDTLQGDMMKVKTTIEFLETSFTPRELSAMFLELVIDDNSR